MKLTVAPAGPATLDTALHVSVTDAPPGAPVTLAASQVDGWGRSLRSSAVFTADAAGTVDVSSRAPVSGDYTGVDPMGLIWSMRPTRGAARARAAGFPAPVHTTFEVAAGDQPGVSVTVERQRLPDGVRRARVTSHGLVGSLFTPTDGGPVPGVILIGGAEGGMHEPDAALLAAHGFAVLALAYFGARGLPSGLVDIPLEYFGRAIDFLSAQRRCRPGQLGIMGASRGGEASLLVAATFAQIGAVVSTAGSGLITAGIQYGPNFLDIVGTNRPSWTLGGAPLPYLPYSVTPQTRAEVAAGEPVHMWRIFQPALHSAATVADAVIPVERINGAVLMVSGADDQAWHCAELSDYAFERLGRKAPHRHVILPGAGHGIAPPPYGPTTEQTGPGPGVTFANGGSPATDAAGRVEAWRLAREHLAEHLPS